MYGSAESQAVSVHTCQMCMTQHSIRPDAWIMIVLHSISFSNRNPIQPAAASGMFLPDRHVPQFEAWRSGHVHHV
jgi:hypothetical protein